MNETETVTIPAHQVRPGDLVLTPDGSVAYRVHHVMTCGKKARTTSLRPLTDDPHHMSPETPVTVTRTMRAR